MPLFPFSFSLFRSLFRFLCPSYLYAHYRSDTKNVTIRTNQEEAWNTNDTINRAIYKSKIWMRRHFFRNKRLRIRESYFSYAYIYWWDVKLRMYLSAMSALLLPNLKTSLKNTNLIFQFFENACTKIVEKILAKWMLDIG